MSKAKTVCASIALLLAALAVNAGEQEKAQVKALEQSAQKWEFHGCAAIPVTPSAEKTVQKPILQLAQRPKDRAKKRGY